MLTRTEYRADIQNIESEFNDIKNTLNEPTGNFFYDPWEIKPEYKGTVWERLLKTLPVDQGEARVIVMSPGTTYMSHADIDDRYHLSLTGEQSYLIDLDNTKMHLLEQDGYWYEMDAGRLHVASNFGSCDRVQLVVRKLLVSTTMPNLVKVKITPTKETYDLRYKFDNIISPWLNRANKNKSLKDFDYNKNGVVFKTTMSELDSLTVTEDFNLEVASIS
jgi:hypothetical protein